MLRTLCFVGLLFSSCSDEAGVIDRPGEPTVISVDDDDAVMNEATAAARASVDRMIERLPALQNAGLYVSVKMPIVTGKKTEHMWVGDLEFRDGKFFGKLANDPVDGDLQSGDAVSVAKADISDWMVVDGTELHGGYTIIVLRNQMSDDKRAEFDASSGLRVPEVARVFD